jgi:hypothetical protein
MAPCHCTMQIPCVLHSVCKTLWLVSVGILPWSRGAATRLVERGGGPVMCLTRPLSSRGSLSSPGPSAWSFTERVVERIFLWVSRSVVVPTAAWECSVNSLPIQCARARSTLNKCRQIQSYLFGARSPRHQVGQNSDHHQLGTGCVTCQSPLSGFA